MRVLAPDTLPGSYEAADALSIRTQRAYLRVTAANAALLVAGAACAAVSSRDPRLVQALNAASALCFGSGLVLTWISSRAERDHKWAAARSRAEEIKSVAWSVMTAGVAIPATLDVTAAMLEVRASPWQQRRDLYVSGRLRDQYAWYGRKAEDARWRARWWGRGLFFSQVAALAVAVAAIWHPSVAFNPRPLLTTFAGVCIGWMRATQYRHLATAYVTAADEIGVFIDRASKVSSDDELRTVVGETEAAMAAERGAWAERRRVS